MKVETLHDNKWLSLMEMKDPDQGVHGYVFSHEVRCQGKIIALLPFRKIGGKFQYLLRKEVTPCWGMEPVVSSITGGYEQNIGIENTALQELKEEAGYQIISKALISLGTCFGTKSTDTVFHLFSANLTNMPRGDAIGDGSELEAKAHCFWDHDICHAQDPLIYTMWFRLISDISFKTAMTLS